MKYHHAALGGTFDHLHSGHKYIIDFALKNAEKLTIAIATAKLHEHKEFPGAIEHFEYRKKVLDQYIKSEKNTERIILTELNDIYGSAISDESFDSIVITDETEANAFKINEEREKRGLAPLALLKCPLLKGPTDEIIRSTNIRAGSTDRTGFPYAQAFSAEVLYLPTNLRKKLTKPFAPPILHENEKLSAEMVAQLLKEKSPFTIAVGDIVNQTLAAAGYTPDIQIIDFKTRREDIQKDNNTTVQYKNPAGTLVRSTVIELNNLIQKTLHNKSSNKLIIDGEEDLLTLPAILFTPLGVYVVYGQFDQGIVVLQVTEDLKKTVLEFVNQFTTTP